MDISTILQTAWKKRGEGLYSEVRELLSAAMEACDESDYDTLGRIYHIYMQIDYDQNNLAEALNLSEKSVAYYKMANNADRIPHSIRHMADLQRLLHRDVESERNYRIAVELYRALPTVHPGDLANALRGFALILEKNGKINEAITTWSEVKGLYQSVHLQAGVDEAKERLDALH